MSSKKEFLNELVRANDLNTDEDVFSMELGGRKMAIITRTGIEKIQYNNGIDVKFDWISMSKDYACIKATATKGDVVIETFGSAWHGQGGNCMSNTLLRWLRREHWQGLSSNCLVLTSMVYTVRTNQMTSKISRGVDGI